MTEKDQDSLLDTIGMVIAILVLLGILAAIYFYFKGSFSGGLQEWFGRS